MSFLCCWERDDRFFDDVDEMRAFMSMFMDLVGMFGSDVPPVPNGCGPGCKGGHVHVPSGERQMRHRLPVVLYFYSCLTG